MPEYLFINPDDPEEVVSVQQSMKEEHKYEANGKAWDRQYTVPKASIDSRIDPEPGKVLSRIQILRRPAFVQT